MILRGTRRREDGKKLVEVFKSFGVEESDPLDSLSSPAPRSFFVIRGRGNSTNSAVFAEDGVFNPTILRFARSGTRYTL